MHKHCTASNWLRYGSIDLIATGLRDADSMGPFGMVNGWSTVATWLIGPFAAVR